MRGNLVEAVKLDLVGPGPDSDLADERLHGWVKPSNWYLTGFLIPSDTPFEDRGDLDEDESLDEVPQIAGLAEESAEERRAAKNGFFPSSIGLSFLESEAFAIVRYTKGYNDRGQGDMALVGKGYPALSTPGGSDRFVPESPSLPPQATCSACGWHHRPAGQRCSRASSVHQPPRGETSAQTPRPGGPSTLAGNVEPSASSSA